MSTTLWGGNFAQLPSHRIMEFTTNRDVASMPPCDSVLLPYSVQGSIAHVLMLTKQHIITPQEAKVLVKALHEILQQIEHGTFVFDLQREDAQTAIEYALIKKIGLEVGGKLHTGRSRNDQVVLDTRLFVREQIIYFYDYLVKLIETITRIIPKYNEVIMPGFTHYQPAMVTTWGHVLASFSVAFSRDAKKFKNWFELYNSNPLGGAASYGTTFPLDREYVSTLLGFTDTEQSSLEPIMHRGEMERDCLHVLLSFMLHASNLAQTLIIFSTKQFGFIELPDNFCTGSSIMPQKKNPDVLEIIKGKTSYLQGQLVAMNSILQHNFIGLNRETQYTKYLICDSLYQVQGVPAILTELLPQLRVYKSKMQHEAEKYFITSTVLVEQLVQKYHINFRAAKRLIEKAISYALKTQRETIGFKEFSQAAAEQGFSFKITKQDLATMQDPTQIVVQGNHIGGPGKKALTKTTAYLLKEGRKQAAFLKKMQGLVQRAAKYRSQAIAHL